MFTNKVSDSKIKRGVQTKARRGQAACKGGQEMT